MGLTLYERVREEMNAEQGIGPRHIASWLNISVSDARHTLQMLVANGEAQFGYLVQDGTDTLAGRGYWLTELGERNNDEARKAIVRDCRG